MSCDDCKIKQDAEQEKTVPWSALELINGGHQQTVKRLWILLLALIIALVGCNIAWIVAWNQYDWVSEDESISLSTRGGGDANYIGNDGDITYGDYPSNQQTDLP